jgi:hypothetical protein
MKLTAITAQYVQLLTAGLATDGLSALTEHDPFALKNGADLQG